MPLKKQHGILLRLAPQGPVSISIIHQVQSGDNWCWAACHSMVLRGHGWSIGQCKVASEALDGDCSKSGMGPCNVRDHARPACDVTYEAEKIEALWHRFGVQAVDEKGVIEKSFVLDELKLEHPLEFLLGTSDKDGHLVLLLKIVNEQEVLVADPIAGGLSSKNFASLEKELGHGPWRRTWTNLHNKVDKDEIRQNLESDRVRHSSTNQRIDRSLCRPN